MKTVGTILRKARESKNVTREALAKKIKISAAYLALLENDSPVSFSARVYLEIKKALGRRSLYGISESMIKRHNKRAYDYYRAYRQKQKAKSKKRAS